MATIDRADVEQIAKYFATWDARDDRYPIAIIAEKFKADGQSPLAFRAAIRRAAVDATWLRLCLDLTPGWTDNAIDTAIRSALKIHGLQADAWAVSQPLKR